MEKLKKGIKTMFRGLKYTKRDVPSLLMLGIGIAIFIVCGLKFRQIMGMALGVLTSLVGIWAVLRDGEEFEEDDDMSVPDV